LARDESINPHVLFALGILLPLGHPGQIGERLGLTPPELLAAGQGAGVSAGNGKEMPAPQQFLPGVDRHLYLPKYRPSVKMHPVVKPD
jgi:hypothetical protein